MSKINEALEDIFRNIFSDQSSELKEQIIPGIISTDHDDSIFIGKTVERKILDLADQMYEQNSEVRKIHLQKEWQAIVRFVIGRSLTSQSDNYESFEADEHQFKQRFKEKLKKHTVYGDLITAYGCWLISPTPMEPIEIGPVRFEEKSRWLDRTFGSSEIPKVISSSLSHEFSDQHLKREKTSLDKLHEENIRREISDAPMICEVLTRGLATELAYKRSIIAAHLALTSISLIWSKPSSILKRFRITLDGKPRSSYSFLIEPNNRKLVSWQLAAQLSEHSISPKMWEENYNYARCFLDIAGEMIGCWTSVKIYSKASPLLCGLSQSLFFFWKACLEGSDILSIVEFVAALEAIAPGRNKRGIFELIEARLGVEKKTKVNPRKNTESDH